METEMIEKDRVRANTKPETQRKIDIKADVMIEFYRSQPRKVILQRIEELESEWDIERILEANASALALTGVLLGMFSSKKWLLLSGAVCGFLFQHAIQGWCPPVPALRKMGVRTLNEINHEKFALKAMVGEFEVEKLKAA